MLKKFTTKKLKKFNTITPYKKFEKELSILNRSTKNIKKTKKDGKKIISYGATYKSATIFNY